MGALRGSALERLERYSIPEPNSGCTPWVGCLTRGGYGQLRVDGRNVVAHRAAWEIENGAVPLGLELDHVCRVRCCINIRHLRAVTHRENVLCGEGNAAVNARKTACIRGHPLTGANLLKQHRGKRQCRECHAIHMSRYGHGYRRRSAA